LFYSQKLFLEFGNPIGIYPIKNNKPKISYSIDEAAVQSINNPEYSLNRIMRIGKFYFPHGCTNWRECPNCGKVQMFLGKQWQYDSNSLFPPGLLPSLRKVEHYISLEEKIKIESGAYDSLQCLCCGEMTRIEHTTMIMQTNFKVQNPPFLEEIQRELKICLENTKHIVFMGYSLPEDDVVWKAILTIKHSFKKGVFCSVVLGYDGKDEWMQGNNLKNFVEENSNKEFSKSIKSVAGIFGWNRVRAYTAGIPKVWLKDGDLKRNIKNLLYPEELSD
jgi:hypothetical protein